MLVNQWISFSVIRDTWFLVGNMPNISSSCLKHKNLISLHLFILCNSKWEDAHFKYPLRVKYFRKFLRNEVYIFSGQTFPKTGQTVTCHYVLTLENGKEVIFSINSKS